MFCLLHFKRWRHSEGTALTDPCYNHNHINLMLLTSLHLPLTQPTKHQKPRCCPLTTAVMIAKLDKEVQTVSLRCFRNARVLRSQTLIR